MHFFIYFFLKPSKTNGTLSCVDPTDSISFTYSNIQNTIIYKGQTAIIRYRLLMNEVTMLNISFSFSSSLNQDEFDLQKLFISNVGDNFPCVGIMTPATYHNGLEKAKI
jgi:hypothetical protein